MRAKACLEAQAPQTGQAKAPLVIGLAEVSSLGRGPRRRGRCGAASRDVFKRPSLATQTWWEHSKVTGSLVLCKAHSRAPRTKRLALKVSWQMGHRSSISICLMKLVLLLLRKSRSSSMSALLAQFVWQRFSRMGTWGIACSSKRNARRGCRGLINKHILSSNVWDPCLSP